ncbi:hypothetical protein FDW91_10225 [Citrobacter sp. wls831]|nr:hypothetical protein FDW91_10225 [Citrobacter sp. wls831]
MSEHEHMSQRERGGGGFKDNHFPARNHPPPQIFMHGDFFENKTKRKTVIYAKTTKTTKTTKTARLP